MVTQNEISKAEIKNFLQKISEFISEIKEGGKGYFVAWVYTIEPILFPHQWAKIEGKTLELLKKTLPLIKEEIDNLSHKQLELLRDVFYQNIFSKIPNKRDQIEVLQIFGDQEFKKTRKTSTACF